MTPGFLKTRYQKRAEKIEGWVLEAERSINEFDEIMAEVKRLENRWTQLTRAGVIPVFQTFPEGVIEKARERSFSEAKAGLEGIRKRLEKYETATRRMMRLTSELNEIIERTANRKDMNLDNEKVDSIRTEIRSHRLDEAERSVIELKKNISKAIESKSLRRGLSSEMNSIRKQWKMLADQDLIEYPYKRERSLQKLLDEGDPQETEAELQKEKKAMERTKKLGFQLMDLRERWRGCKETAGDKVEYRDDKLIANYIKEGELDIAEELLDRMNKVVSEMEIKIAKEENKDSFIEDKEVFISYASDDKNVAFAVCHALEQKRIKCWIAPRDVLPGESYGKAIIGAINKTQVMVLVFSSKSNTSPQVLREVERAVSKGIAIVPLRIEDVLPSDEFEYFISSSHWLDALTPPIEDHVDRLTDSVISIINDMHARRRRY